MIFDMDLIGRRRAELDLSSRELGNRLGVSFMTIRNLERGVNHENLPVRFVQRLAELLGLSLANLILDRHTSASPAEDRDHATQIGAVLAEATRALPVSTIAEACRLNIDETCEAIDELERRLVGTGTCLIRLEQAVAVRPTVVDLHAKAVLTRKDQARTGLSFTETRLMFENIFGIKNIGLNNSERIAMQRLHNAGLVDRETGKPSQQVMMALSPGDHTLS